MNLISIFSKYPTQEACIEHLETVRWDDNPTCPYCKSDKVARKNELDKVGRWNCHFPGVEITASGGIHVLGILDTNSVSADVATLLGPVGYQGQRGASEVAAELAPLSVVEAVCNAGGIPLLAHVDGPPGAWGLKGNTLTSLLDFSGLFAMEVVDLCSDPPELYRQRKLAWSDVIGSDSHHPAGSTGERFPGSHYTWVKMAKPSIEGLRLALLDGNGFSIRRSDGQEPFDPFRNAETLHRVH